MDRSKELRKGLRISLTKSINAFHDLLNTNPDTPDLLPLVNKVECTWAKLTVIDESILQTVDVADIATEVDAAEQYEHNVIDVRTVMEVRARKPDSSDASSVATGISHVRQRHARLPKLELPTFTGDYLTWLDFWEVYECNVHKADDIHATEKFSYLRAYLGGKARQLIKGIPLTAMGYDQAVDLLRERYANPNRLVNAHVRELLSIEPLKQNKNAQLEALVDKIEVHVRALDTLGLAKDTYGCFLLPIVLSRLPNSTKLAWNRLDEDENLDIQRLMKFLHNEAKALERLDEDTPRYSATTKTAATLVKQQEKYNPRSQANAQNRRPLLCHLCKQQHTLRNCADFKAMETKKRGEFLRDRKLCLNCFGGHHLAPDCSFRSLCEHCDGKHNTLLHGEGRPATSQQTSASCNVKSAIGLSAETRVCDVLLPSVVFQVKSPQGSLPVVTLLDSGSQISLIRKELVPLIEREFIPGTSTLNLVGINSACRVRDSRSMGITIITEGGLISLVVTEIENIGVSTVIPANPERIAHHGSVNEIKLSAPCEIDMILGADVLPMILTGQVRQLEKGLCGLGTVSGWSLMGRIDDTSRSCMTATLQQNGEELLWKTESPQLGFMDKTTCTAITMVEDPGDMCWQSQSELTEETFDALLQRFWELEGCSESSDLKMSDELALKCFNSSISRGQDGRYTVAWPIACDISHIQTYEREAYGRYNQLKRRLATDTALQMEYSKILHEYEQLGIIEQCDQPYDNAVAVRYLPHHPVVKWQKEKSKVRIVFDASAKDSDKVSLNGVMLNGPNLNPEVPAVLIRFRMRRYALIGDIEKAFLQLSLANEQRDLTRFLWEDPLTNSTIVFRMTRVLFGATASPFLLAATLQHHIMSMEHEHRETCHAIARNFYVDDLAVSASSVAELVAIHDETTHIMKNMQCNIRGWVSNCVDTGRDISMPDQVGVLGVQWNPRSDTLIVEVPSQAQNGPFTKRQLLQHIAKIWDPLGIIAPMTVCGKLLIRDLWKSGCNWDDSLPNELETRIADYLHLLSSQGSRTIPRCLGISHSMVSLELHGFGDASGRAIGAVVFSRAVFEGDITLSFVVAKTKLSPSKPMSIPRLELSASQLLCKLVNYVVQAIDVECSIYCWSDSRCALAWIQNEPGRWKPFVGNRVKEIQELLPLAKWGFISGVDNPADILSRGVGDPKTDWDNWLQPPAFLFERNLPQSPKAGDETDETGQRIIDKEERKIVRVCSAVVEPPVFDCSRFSQLRRLLNTVVMVRRFGSPVLVGKRSEMIPSTELNDALDLLIKLNQRSTFSHEIRCLEEGDSLDGEGSSILNLRPFLDQQGLLRSDRRLQLSDMSYSEKFPIILERTWDLTRLLVVQAHVRLGHAGVSQTLSELRRSYWIAKARSTVRKLLFDCVICRRFNATVCDAVSPPLPEERVSEASRPFLSVGIDFTGPVATIDGEKQYVLLITCTRIRAVHLELVPRLDKSSCLLALRCFFYRRGIPEIIISDNAKTFCSLVEHMASEYRVTWKFITPKAPWRGGFYERLNKSLKDPLKRMIGTKVISKEQLRCVLCHVEAIVNSRPISPQSDDVNDDLVLSPSHFLIGDSLFRLPTRHSISESDPPPTVAPNFGALLRGRNDTLRNFWNLWKQNYLRALRQNTKTLSGSDLNVGDLVLVNNEKDRSQWPLAIVTTLMPANDNKVRTVEVRMNKKRFLRPVQRLYLLEGRRQQ